MGLLMLLITTSRRPSRRTRSFIRDLYHVIPGAKRVNRGKKSAEDLKKLAIGEGLKRVLIVGTLKGNPSTLTFLSTLPTEVQYLPLMIWLNGVTLRREMTKRRAPFVRSLGVARTPRVPDEFVLGFSSGLGTDDFKEIEEPEDVPKLVDYYDVILLIQKKGKEIVASFYCTHPAFELGPRMYLGGVKKIGGNSIDND